MYAALEMVMWQVVFGNRVERVRVGDWIDRLRGIVFSFENRSVSYVSTHLICISEVLSS